MLNTDNSGINILTLCHWVTGKNKAHFTTHSKPLCNRDYRTDSRSFVLGVKPLKISLCAYKHTHTHLLEEFLFQTQGYQVV